MISHCSKCNKDFNEKVGMGLLNGLLALKLKNHIGNICPDCALQLQETKKGRRTLFFQSFKLFLLYVAVLFPVLALFTAFTLILAFNL